MGKRVAVVMCLGLLGVALISGAASAIMVALSVDDLTAQAEVVVVGRVSDIQSAWSADGKTINTTVTIEVTDTVKGQTEGKEIGLTYPGGVVGEVGLKVSDTPSFEPDERVLVFLSAPPQAQGTSQSAPVIYEVVGLAQGKYSISDDGMATKSGYSVAGDMERTDASLPLEELIEKIRKADGGQK